MDIQADDGCWFTVRLLPYRTTDNAISGVVLTFIDITAQRATALSQVMSEGIVTTMREPLLVLNSKLEVKSANPAFYRTFKVSPQETLERPVYELGGGEWNIPALRSLLEEVIPQKTAITDYEVEHDFPRIGRKTMRLNARRLIAGGEHPELILLALEDVSEQRGFEQELRQTIDQLKGQVQELTDNKDKK